MRTPGEGTVSSAARVLQPDEQKDLIAIAQGLPETWCVQLVPPLGQVCITPYSGRQRYVRCWVGSRAVGRLFHERWRPPT